MSISSTRCAACKYLRRKCPSDCIFSPYFPPNDPQRFICVHKIYGSSKVGKMLQNLPEELRGEAADAISIEAQCRVQDPVYGCARMINLLHQQILNAERQLAKARADIVVLNSHAQELQDQEIQSAGFSSSTSINPQQGNHVYYHFGSHNNQS